jgi:hypothetical protein
MHDFFQKSKTHSLKTPVLENKIQKNVAEQKIQNGH